MHAPRPHLHGTNFHVSTPSSRRAVPASWWQHARPGLCRHARCTAHVSLPPPAHAKRRHRSALTRAGVGAGEEVVEYMGPRPPVGIHRYVLVLFEQKTRVHAEAPGDRANFKTRAFAAAHELGLPTAVVYFNAQKEPASRRR
jgi:hypothetical protein